MQYIGKSPCPCGEMITGTLTGNVKKCDQHPSDLCWFWEWEAGTSCPVCGAIQIYLHQPEGSQEGADLEGILPLLDEKLK